MPSPPIEIPRPLIDRLRRLALVSGHPTDDLRPMIVEALRAGGPRADGPPPLPASRAPTRPA